MIHMSKKVRKLRKCSWSQKSLSSKRFILEQICQDFFLKRFELLKMVHIKNKIHKN
jgi:hypothetical protein